MVDFGINETLETDVEDVWRGTGTSPQREGVNIFAEKRGTGKTSPFWRFTELWILGC